MNNERGAKQGPMNNRVLHKPRRDFLGILQCFLRAAVVENLSDLNLNLEPDMLKPKLLRI